MMSCHCVIMGTSTIVEILISTILISITYHQALCGGAISASTALPGDEETTTHLFQYDARLVTTKTPLPIPLSLTHTHTLLAVKRSDCAQECSRLTTHEATEESKSNLWCRSFYFDKKTSTCVFFNQTLDQYGVVVVRTQNGSVDDDDDVAIQTCDGGDVTYDDTAVNITCKTFIAFQRRFKRCNEINPGFVELVDDNGGNQHTPPTSYCVAYFESSVLPFDQARTQCQSKGAFLPHIDSIRKLTILHRHASQHDPNRPEYWVGVGKEAGTTSQYYHTKTGAVVPSTSLLWETASNKKPMYSNNAAGVYSQRGTRLVTQKSSNLVFGLMCEIDVKQ